jgi:hypothetical protein
LVPFVSRDSDSGRLVASVGLGALVAFDSCFDGLVMSVCLGPLVSRDSDSGRLVTPVVLGAFVPVDSCFDG